MDAGGGSERHSGKFIKSVVRSTFPCSPERERERERERKRTRGRWWRWKWADVLEIIKDLQPDGCCCHFFWFFFNFLFFRLFCSFLIHISLLAEVFLDWEFSVFHFILLYFTWIYRFFHVLHVSQRFIMIFWLKFLLGFMRFYWWFSYFLFTILIFQIHFYRVRFLVSLHCVVLSFFLVELFINLKFSFHE